MKALFTFSIRKECSIKEFRDDPEALQRILACDPMIAAEEALALYAQNGIIHNDARWRHVSLLPVFGSDSGVAGLKPILIDNSDVQREPEKSSEELFLLMKSQLLES